MKIRNYILACVALLLVSCHPLDTRFDTLISEENLNSNYNYIRDLGYAPYTYLRSGFWFIDSNIPAAMSDEAEMTSSSSSTQKFNEGSWSQYSNPDDVYSYLYQGIRAANYFREYTTDYVRQLAHNRDTLSDRGYQYRLDVADIGWMRAEARVLRAYFYSQLLKRYGDVPLVKEVLPFDGDGNLPRTPINEIVTYAVSEIDAALDSLQTDWKQYDAERDGRFTRGAALALKSRLLLYAASPLYNTDGDAARWRQAAQAAYEVINLHQYFLSADYRNLFLEDNAAKDGEIILSIRSGSTNEMERANYPVGTQGGYSGITPSQNLVEAYEYKGNPDPSNPYANRDPRLQQTIVVNNSSWNGRTMEIYAGGQDDPANTNSSRTGYYLKKFLIENLFLLQDETRIHNWVVFRYAEVLLNYAEAMNEAYGPDVDNGYGLTARDALNSVRAREGVEMPPVVATTQTEFRACVKHERRIELAFEDHRYWDLRRWKDAATVLNEPLRGVHITRGGSGEFTYTTFTVESRTFIAPKMYLYPIPETEINKSGGVLTQNEGW
jgi:hypothetical protein